MRWRTLLLITLVAGGLVVFLGMQANATQDECRVFYGHGGHLPDQYDYGIFIEYDPPVRVVSETSTNPRDYGAGNRWDEIHKCKVVEPTTTTTIPPTTTVPDSTTTSILTTTTTMPTTTSTVPEETTTTPKPPETTITSEATTSTTEVCLDIERSARGCCPDEVEAGDPICFPPEETTTTTQPAPELPYTGPAHWAWGVLGFLLLAGGVMIVRDGRVRSTA